MHILKRCVPLAAIISLLAMTTGCNNNLDLGAVKDFTAKASEASEKFPLIADDFQGSCFRHASYQPIGQVSDQDINDALEKIEAIDDPVFKAALKDKFNAALKDKSDPLKSSNTSSPFMLRDLRRVACERYSGLGRTLNERHQFLFTYLETIGELASDKLVDYSAEVDTLGGSVQKAAIALGAKKEDAEGQQGIFKLIFNSIFTASADNYRRDRLKEYLVNNSGTVDQYIGFLQPDVRAYLVALEAEDVLLSSYYRFSILGEFRPRQGVALLPGQQPTLISSRGLSESAMNIDRRFEDARAALRRRQEAGTGYLSTLEILQNANVEFACKLADDKSKLEFQERCPTDPPRMEGIARQAAKPPLDILKSTATKYYLQLKPELARINNNLR